MLRHVGLRGISTNSTDFDERFVAHLVRLVRTSTVGALVLLAQDEVYTPNGEKMEGRGSFYVPNDYLFDVCREHPEFFPAASVHPARPDALEELESCIEQGAVMLKLLPNCHNVDCNDRRYRKFWERMAAAKLPLLAPEQDEALLREAGFPDVSLFYAGFAFRGWVAYAGRS
jgi:predicted TIM-barrel fold metal-dependent hydrolase